MNLAVDAELAHTTRNQLRVLRAKIQDQYFLSHAGKYSKKEQINERAKIILIIVKE